MNKNYNKGDEYKFVLPFELKSLNSTLGYHWKKKYDETRRIAEHLQPQVNNYGIRDIGFERVKIAVKCYRHSLIKDTSDNLPASLKPLLDALQPPIRVAPTPKHIDGIRAGYRLGVILDDSKKVIPGLIKYEQFIDRKNRRTEITIRDITS